jgi:hypothetical protein
MRALGGEESRLADVIVDLDELGRLLQLPEGVEIVSVYDHREDPRIGYRRIVLRLKGPGLPDECRVRTGDVVMNLDPVLSRNERGGIVWNW